MESVRTLLIDAFTDDPLAGNAAGVVPNADALTDEQCRAIARELSVSETAFLTDSERADRRVRYFTPTTEVDLCGHATIACHAHLFEEDEIDTGTHTIETNVGVLDIEVESDGTVWMTQDDPSVETVDIDYDRVASALDIDPAALADVGADLPLARASTGLAFLVVPVNFLEHVGRITPELSAVETLCEEVDATGLYAFTFDTLHGESTFHGRMFAPLAGVSEDPVTGTAGGAVGAYLRAVEAFEAEAGGGPTEGGRDPRAMPERMVVEQGHFADRPGQVVVRIGDRVRVGGRAVTALDGTLRVPATEQDDVLEA